MSSTVNYVQSPQDFHRLPAENQDSNPSQILPDPVSISPPTQSSENRVLSASQNGETLDGSITCPCCGTRGFVEWLTVRTLDALHSVSYESFFCHNCLEQFPEKRSDSRHLAVEFV